MIYFLLYLISVVLSSILLTYNNWLFGEYDFADYLFTGFVSLFSPIVIPVFLIGFIGRKISETIKS